MDVIQFGVSRTSGLTRAVGEDSGIIGQEPQQVGDAAIAVPAEHLSGDVGWNPVLRP